MCRTTTGRRVWPLLLLLLLVFVCWLLLESELDRRRAKDQFTVNHWYKHGYFSTSPYNNLIQDVLPPAQSAPMLPMSMFPQNTLFVNNWEAIRDEALSTLDQADEAMSITPALVKRVATSKWKMFVLHWYGTDYPENLKQCPITASLIKQVPGIRIAMFSIMEAGNYVPAHRGPYRGSIRYLMGLQTPKDREKCFIVVGGEKHHYTEGEGVLFDDTFKHYVVNDTPDRRIVLFLDIDRPFPTSNIVSNMTRWFSNSPIPAAFAKINAKQEGSVAIESNRQ